MPVEDIYVTIRVGTLQEFIDEVTPIFNKTASDFDIKKLQNFLYVAVVYNREDIIRYLLEQGIQPENNNLILQEAYKHRHDEIIDLLLYGVKKKDC